MTSKDSSMPPYLQNLPPGISVRKLRGGHLRFTIKTDLAVITCTYDPTHVAERLEERVADLFEKARTGSAGNPAAGIPDFVIYHGSNVRALVEVKGQNVRDFGSIKYSKFKLHKESERYVEHSLNRFLQSFHLELRDVPSLFLIKMLAVTLGDLAGVGILKTEKTVIKIINEIYEELSKDFKDKWNAPEKGRPGKWPKDKSPADFLKVYNKAIRDVKKIQEICKNSLERRTDPVDKIVQKYPDVPITIVRAIMSHTPGQRGHDTPAKHARKLAARRFNVNDGYYLEDVLRDARREAKQRG